MELADRKSLLKILSFLDGKLPQFSSIHGLVNTALLSSTNSTHRYRVYFEPNRNRKVSNSVRDEEDYAVIVVAILNILTETTSKNGRVWRLTGWANKDEDLVCAIDALKEIKWHEDYVVVVGNDYKPDPNMQQLLISKRGLDIENLQCKALDQLYLPIEQALNLQLSPMPEDIYVKSLEHCHAQIVYDHWSYRKTTSVEIIAEEINTLPSAGVFLKTTNELVSWMTYLPTNGMSMLHTLEMYRRKGYASLVIRYLSKRIAQAGLIPTANVLVENDASLELFKSNGYQFLQPWHIYHLSHFVNAGI